MRWDHSYRNPRPGLALRLFPRLVLGYIIALLLIVPLTARFVGSWPPYTIAVTMQSQVSGHLEVFYEAGEGFSGAQSAKLPLTLSDAPHEYRLILMLRTCSARSLRTGDRSPPSNPPTVKRLMPHEAC